jgi:hypothetical protein
MSVGNRAASAQGMSISRDVCSEGGWLICGIDTGDGLAVRSRSCANLASPSQGNDDCGVVLSPIAAFCKGRVTAPTPLYQPYDCLETCDISLKPLVDVSSTSH